MTLRCHPCHGRDTKTEHEPKEIDMAGWKIKGLTDAATTCEVCGRMELKRTVFLVTEEGDELYAGTTCAARKVGVPAAKMRDAVKAFDLHFQVARSNFPDHFRRIMGRTVEQHLREFPHARKVAEAMYRRYMASEGFTV